MGAQRGGGWGGVGVGGGGGGVPNLFDTRVLPSMQAGHRVMNEKSNQHVST